MAWEDHLKTPKIAASTVKATSLQWDDNTSPRNNVTVSASWILATDADLVSQTIEFFNDPVCGGSSYSNTVLGPFISSQALPGTASEGLHSYKVTSTHMSGAVEPSNCSVPIEIDTTPPANAVPAGWAQISPYRFRSITANWTKSSDARLSNQMIQYYSGAGCANASGPLINLSSAMLVSHTWTTPTDDTFAYKITSVDSAGNTNTSSCSSSLDVDTLAPTNATPLPWSEVSPYGSTSITANWAKSSDTGLADQKIQFYSGTAGCTTTSGAEIDLTSADVSHLWTAPGDGEFRFKVTSIDSAGNTNISACSAPMIVDDTDPLAATPQAWSEVSPHGALTITANWTKSADPGLSNQLIQFFTDPSCTTASGPAIDLASTSVQTHSWGAPNDGSYKFQIISVDQALNSSTSACSSAMVIDTTPPENATTLIWDGTSPQYTLSIRAKWTLSTDPLSDQKIQFYSDSDCLVPSGSEIDLDNTSASYLWNAPGTGSYKYKIRSIDIANNSATSGCSSAMVVNYTPFTHNWPFTAGTEAAYSFSTSSIDFTGGVARLKPTDQTDAGISTSDFGGGTMDGVSWDSTNEYLRLDRSGTPTNRAALDSSWTPKYSDIISYWKFDGTGTLTNGSPVSADIGPGGVVDVDGANDTIVGGTVNYSYSSGKIGSGLNGGGGSRGIELTQTDANSTFNFPENTFSISVWYNSSAVGTSEGILGLWGTPNYLALHFSSANLIALEGNDSNGAFTSARAAAPRDGKWHHLVGVRVAGKFRLYLDGSFLVESPETRSGHYNATAGATVGAMDTVPLRGIIDDLALWKTALTADEVAVIHSRQSAQYSGTFTSRVMDALATGQSWTTLSWIPTLPFLKPLPAGSTSETSSNYSSLKGSDGNTGSDDLMNGIVGLWHLDDSSTDPNGIRDSSGKNHHGSVVNSVTLQKRGRFHRAAEFDSGTSDAIQVPGTSDLHPTAALSVSLWIKLHSNLSSVTQTFISTAQSGGYALGIQKSSASNCPSSLCFQVNVDGTYSAVSTPRNQLTVGQWHHLAATYDGLTLKLYLDGVLESTTSIAGSIQYSYPSNPFCIGKDASISDCNDGSGTHGAVDEVALWTRDLHANEIHQLYRRGANRLKYQVRTCTAGDCSDDAAGANWKGPDGTRYSYFSELHNRTAQDPSQSGNVRANLPLLTFANFTSPIGTSRYFQYRTVLESDDANALCNYNGTATWCSPELKAVKVDPVHYDTTAPSIQSVIGVSYRTLTNFTQTLGLACPDGIGYTLSRDQTTWFYWNGTVWSPSDGTVAQSSSASMVQSGISGFPTQVGIGNLYLKAFLISSGSNACELDDVSVDGIQ